MKDYGKVQSSSQPEEITFTDSKVFIASNITSFSVTIGGYSESGYEYDYVEYEKDEYIQLLSSQSRQLAEELAAAKILLGVE